MTAEPEALHHPHSPSWMNKGILCIHFEGGPAGPAAERGTRIHAAIAKVLQSGGAWVPTGTPEDDAAVTFALETVQEHLRHVDGVERLLELRDGGGQA